MSPFAIGALLASYLIAAIPFGYILYRLKSGRDIRGEGSGNIGATNVMRSAGRAVGITVFALDVIKGAAGVALARWVTGDAAWESAAAVAAVVGHCFPVYLRFRGGKGIATGCGAFGFLVPVDMGMTLIVFTVATALSRMVSVGSVMAGLTFPVVLYFMGRDRVIFMAALAAAVIVVIRHQSNLRNVFKGEEGRIGEP